MAWREFVNSDLISFHSFCSLQSSEISSSLGRHCTRSAWISFTASSSPDCYLMSPWICFFFISYFGSAAICLIRRKVTPGTVWLRTLRNRVKKSVCRWILFADAQSGRIPDNKHAASITSTTNGGGFTNALITARSDRFCSSTRQRLREQHAKVASPCQDVLEFLWLEPLPHFWQFWQVLLISVEITSWTSLTCSWSTLCVAMSWYISFAFCSSIGWSERMNGIQLLLNFAVCLC